MDEHETEGAEEREGPASELRAEAENADLSWPVPEIQLPPSGPASLVWPARDDFLD